MEGYSRRKMVGIVIVEALGLTLWVLWTSLCHLPTRRPRMPLPVEANQLIQPSNTNYSKLSLTYDRVVLPDCSDVFISVRTTAQFHRSRLLLLLYTWLQTVNPKQVNKSICILDMANPCTTAFILILNLILQVQIVTDSINDTWINTAKRAGMLYIYI